MQFLFRIPLQFVAIFIALISRSHFAMRYYLENPSHQLQKGSAVNANTLISVPIDFKNSYYLIPKKHEVVIQK